MRITCDHGMGCRCGGIGCGCRGGCTFSDHYTWPSMRELLLQSENLLRKGVDFGVLFVNLFCQSFKLRGLSRFCFMRGGAFRKSHPKRERAYCAENAGYLHGNEILPSGHLSDKRVRRTEPLFFNA